MQWPRGCTLFANGFASQILTHTLRDLLSLLLLTGASHGTELVKNIEKFWQITNIYLPTKFLALNCQTTLCIVGNITSLLKTKELATVSLHT